MILQSASLHVMGRLMDEGEINKIRSIRNWLLIAFMLSIAISMMLLVLGDNHARRLSVIPFIALFFIGRQLIAFNRIIRTRYISEIFAKITQKSKNYKFLRWNYFLHIDVEFREMPITINKKEWDILNDGQEIALSFVPSNKYIVNIRSIRD